MFEPVTVQEDCYQQEAERGVHFRNLPSCADQFQCVRIRRTVYLFSEHHNFLLVGKYGHYGTVYTCVLEYLWILLFFLIFASFNPSSVVISQVTKQKGASEHIQWLVQHREWTKSHYQLTRCGHAPHEGAWFFSCAFRKTLVLTFSVRNNIVAIC
jgi:hypothetical protein